MLISLDLLGESVTSLAEATAATRGYLDVIDAIIASGIERNISLKLTQLGLDVDQGVRGRQPAQDPRARRPGRVLRPHRHGELALHRSDARHLRDAVGPRLHPARRRAAVDALSQRAGSRADEQRSARASGWSKAPTRRAKAVAHAKKSDVDAAYARMMKALLTDGTLSRDRDARSGDDRARARVGTRRTASRPIASSSRCCTASAAICSRC